MFLSILRDAEEVSDVDGDGIFHLADNIGILTFERENGKKKAFLLPRIRDEAGILHQIHKAYTFFSHHSLHLTLLP